MFELDTTRIMLLGDTHGDIEAVKTAAKAARNLQMPYIIQVGDFGFWPHEPSGAEFLEKASEVLQEVGVQLFFIDGNHENFDMLYEIPLQKNGLRETAPNITHIPRGTRGRIGEFEFGFLGGGVSIDRAYRVLGKSWWRQEEILAEDVEKLGEGKLDVLVTHDTPFLELAGFTSFPGSESTRFHLKEAVRRTLPDLLIHGHLHKYYIDSIYLPVGVSSGLDWHRIKVISLADNNAKVPRNRLLLNTINREEL